MVSTKRILGGALLGFAALFSTASAKEDLLRAEISTVGIDLLSQAPVVILNELEEGHTIPIWIGVAEAQAILRGLHEIETVRPMTHDLIHGIVGSLGYRVDHVKVHDLRNGIYYGSIVLQNHLTGEQITVDSRPSDALAVATRSGIGIYITPQLLEQDRDFLFQPADRENAIVRLLGMTLVTLTEEIKSDQNWEDPPAGVLIQEVRGIAQTSGIEALDILISVEDQPVSTPDAILEAYQGREKPTQLRISVWRNGSTLEKDLPIEEIRQVEEGIEI